MRKDLSRRSKLEVILALICVGGLFATSNYLFISKKSEIQETHTESVGSIKPVGADIRVKGEQEFSWNTVARDTSVFRNDKVFTGKNSQAKVKLKSSQKFTVEPNSLIVISDEVDNQRISFTTGGLIAELKKGAKLFVKFKGKEATITSSDSAVMRLHASKEGDFKLIVLRGEAQVMKSSDRPSVSIKANETLDIAEDEAKPTLASLILLTPEPGEEIWSDSREVNFSWQGKTDSNVLLEISHEPEFDSIVESKLVQGNKALIRLPKKGVYFWRISDPNQPDKKSPVSSFSFLDLLPAMLEAVKVVEVELDHEHRSLAPVTLNWQDAIASDSYDVELSKQQSFGTIESRHQTEKTELQLDRLTLGEYYWRVTSNSKRRKALLSNVGILRLQEKLKPITSTISSKRIPAQDASPVLTSPPPIPVAVRQEKPPLEKAAPLAQVHKALTSQKPEMKAEEAEISPPPQQESSPVVTMKPTGRKALDPEFWLWGGIGENYQYYKQSVPSNAGSAEFQNITAPTLYLSVGAQGENFGAEFVHKETPGKMSAPAGSTITNGAYIWKSLSTEGLYRPDDSNWRFRFGVQSHSMPFMVYTPSLALLDIKTNSLVMATLGFDRTYLISNKLRGEWQLRYQHPVTSGASSGDSFKLSPQFAFDGSVGVIYQVTDRFRLGMFWYGQYHHYRFDYSGSSNFSGEQTLFYSNAELRAGFEF